MITRDNTIKTYIPKRIYSVHRIIIRSFPHSWLITGFVTRVKRRRPLIEQNCLPFWRTSLIFSGVRFAEIVVFCAEFSWLLLAFLSHFILAIVLSVYGVTTFDYICGNTSNCSNNIYNIIVHFILGTAAAPDQHGYFIPTLGKIYWLTSEHILAVEWKALKHNTSLYKYNNILFYFCV